MKTFTIEVRGKTEFDIIYALEEIQRRINRDSLAGFESNENIDFKYVSEGDYEEPEEEQ